MDDAPLSEAQLIILVSRVRDGERDVAVARDAARDLGRSTGAILVQLRAALRA